MQIETFRRILYLDLRPSMVEKFPTAKVKNLLLEMEDVKYKHQPLFEVEKERVLTAVHEFYQRLIGNAAIAFLNDFRSELNKATTDHERQYIISTALKQLTFYLQESYFGIANGINSLTESLFKPTLKHELVRLYAEVSSEQKIEIDEAFIDEVYERFYFEHSPKPSLIHDSSIIVVVQDLKPKKVITDTDFQIRYADFRPEKRGILSYETIIKNQKRFAEFEEHLFSYGFIDENYNFTNKHGMKTELAKKYHELINDGCFMPRDFNLLKDIQGRDIRIFLDHRYQVNLDKQFRNMMGKL